MLLQLTAGTLFTQTTFGATGFSGTRAWDVNGSLSIHGSRTGNNEFLVEGAPSAGTGGGTGNWNYAPPVDAIEEFKVSTASVDASFGRTSGGVVNMTLRSGTNQMRGSGILLHRGTWLDANQIQNIRNKISNKEHKYFNGEAMVSGPVRRGKTFFMGGYQGFYENIPFPVTRTIPTAAQLRGDFSQTTTANGTPILIYDPATTTCTANLSACTRQPFPATSSEKPWTRSRRRCCRTSQGKRHTEQTCRARAISSASPTWDATATTPISRHRRFQQHAQAVVQQHRELGIEFRNEKRAARAGESGATNIRRIGTTTSRRVDDNGPWGPRRCGTRGSRGTASTSRTTSSTRHRSEAAVHGPIRCRPAVSADQHRHL